MRDQVLYAWKKPAEEHTGMMRFHSPGEREEKNIILKESLSLRKMNQNLMITEQIRREAEALDVIIDTTAG